MYLTIKRNVFKVGCMPVNQLDISLQNYLPGMGYFAYINKKYLDV